MTSDEKTDWAETVVDLARHSEHLTQQVALHKGRLHELSQRSDELESAQTEIGQGLDAMSQALQDIIGSVSWMKAPRAAMEKWVDEWLLPTFVPNQSLKGWRNTPAVVSELNALWLGFLSIGDKPGFKGMAWHSDLYRAIERMVEYQAKTESARSLQTRQR